MKKLSQTILENENQLYNQIFRENKRYTTKTIFDLFWNIYNTNHQLHLIAGKRGMGVHSLLMHVAYKASQTLKILIWSNQNEFTLARSMLDQSMYSSENNISGNQKSAFFNSIINTNFENIVYQSYPTHALFDAEKVNEVYHQFNFDLLIIDNSEMSDLTSSKKLPPNWKTLQHLKQLALRKKFDIVCSCGIPSDYNKTEENPIAKKVQQLFLPENYTDLFDTIVCLFRPDFFDIKFDKKNNYKLGMAEIFHLKNNGGKIRKETIGFDARNGVFKSPENLISYNN